jgi:hypothetical protein
MVAWFEIFRRASFRKNASVGAAEIMPPPRLIH